MYRQIPSEPNYEASTEGHIRRIGNPNPRKLSLDRWGYWHTDCWTNGQRRNRAVHRLVLEAHIGPGQDKECNHLDFNRTNNRLENLEWVTPLANKHHQIAAERQFSKLTRADVICLRIDHFGYSRKELALIYGVHNDTIRDTVTRRWWKHV